MSSFLTPQSLFSLENYSHAALFDGCSFAWEGLDKLLDYLSQQKLGEIEVEIPSSVVLVNPHLISIGKGCVIEPGVMIQGPCVIGEGCTIRHGAYLRGGVVLGKGCVVGHNTEVKHSIFLDRAAAPHFNYVGDSILGNDVNLGAGVKCANVRLDRLPVRIRAFGQVFETGLKKCGALIGDGSQLGCNSVANPGTIFSKNSTCLPCQNVGGYITCEQGNLS